LAIGSLGDITFEVSRDKVFTFDELRRDVKMRYAKHEIIGNKPILELVGPDLSEIKFKMILSASMGVNPLKEMDAIYTAYTNGEAMVLMLGNYVIGNYKWVISDFCEGYSAIDNLGNVWRLEVDITLQEYVEQIGDSTSSTTTTSTTTSTTSSSDTDSTSISGDGDGGENPTLG